MTAEISESKVDEVEVGCGGGGAVYDK